MAKAIPTILVDGKVYEIKRNRYILCEIEKQQGISVLTEEEQAQIAILEDKYSRVRKLALKLKELEDKYFDTFDDADGEKYNKAKSLYDTMFADAVACEAKAQEAMKKSQKSAIDKMEQIVIFALTVNYYTGEFERTKEEATEIWCKFVDAIGRETAAEWLTYVFQYLTGADEENDDAFFVAARQKAEQSMNMRRGIEGAK